MTLEALLHRRHFTAATEVICLVYQGLLHSFMPIQDNHWPWTKVHSEHRAIFFLELQEGLEYGINADL